MKSEPRLLPVRVLGDDILRQKAVAVEEINSDILDFAEDLVHTMYLRDGVGLAAPQVGKSIRIFAVDPWYTREEREKSPIVMINPVIESASGESVNEEGCISVPGVFANVLRPSAITISYTDLEGERQSLDLTGFEAIVVQHENDHLDGVLFIDKINLMDKMKHMRRLKAIQSSAVDGVNIREDIFEGE